MPARANIAVTAIAIPSKPASENATMIAAQIISAGIAVASIEIARPWITFVPCPVVDDWAIERTGRYFVPV